MPPAFVSLAFGQFAIALAIAAGALDVGLLAREQARQQARDRLGRRDVPRVGIVLPVYFIHYYATRRRI